VVVINGSSWFCEDKKEVSIYWWLLASATEVGESVVSNLKETMKTTKESQ
jgi:hypothetical protein